jgi:acyl carrier protein
MHLTQTSERDINFIVRDIMMYKLGLEQDQLQDTARLQDDLGIDSLDIIELKMEIENKFSITFSEEEAEKMHTVGSIIRCVQTKMNQ